MPKALLGAAAGFFIAAAVVIASSPWGLMLPKSLAEWEVREIQRSVNVCLIVGTFAGGILLAHWEGRKWKPATKHRSESVSRISDGFDELRR